MIFDVQLDEQPLGSRLSTSRQLRNRQALAVNITTLEFQSDGACTPLKVTAQVASFVGAGMLQISGHAFDRALTTRFCILDRNDNL